ncbi:MULTISPECIES: stalk domain-containing protein [unclassified Paenibacillus]|uniref:stalk domain-containing protein n=1 Tax=unclassified Paenibacillus TaxID=185978 RepID=UPI0009A6A3EE|nr:MULTISPECIES: stalk domain-containing protein [unclassified Paenibacillus]SLK10226.1 Glycosyl hydrolases family 18 [Paenibacillus sp. RU5A]SOC71942.1 Glycosyl hydrolases family 18 [Paenibacillus sp. RU26A]SOC74297.1 Glycosyl hydrolases family 18 [Paenibacillus sp. RU5M]
MLHTRIGKTAAATILAISLLGTTANLNDAYAAPAISVLLDDVPLKFDATPLIDKGVTYVPFRTVGEALGISITWNSKAQTVKAIGKVKGQATEVLLQVGSTTATVNGEKVKLAAPPVQREGRVLIPLSSFSSQFGVNVGWNQSTRTVSLVSPQREMHLRAFYALQSYKEIDLVPSMNSVAFGWSRIDREGQFTLQGDEYQIPAAAGDVTPKSIVADAAKQSIKPYLMVYSLDGNGELTKVLSDSSMRQKSIEGITAAIAENGFGGVVLDFEGLGFKLDAVEQQKLLNNYVKQLKDSLPKDIALSLAVPPLNSAYKGYDYKTLASLADDIIIMAYQYNPVGTKSQVPEPNSLVDQAIQLALDAGVSKQKLLLGISLNSETSSSIDDKLGLAKRYDLKGAAFWRLGLFRTYNNQMERAVNASVIKE